MERRKLHTSGPAFSRIISGAWRWHTVAPDTVEKLIHTSLDHGITTFDHADIYGDHSNEEIFGHVLKKHKALRDKMEIVTKCGIRSVSAKRPGVWIKHYDTSKAHILWSAENSLKMLGTDRLDLLLIHRPDPLLDPAEVAEAFSQLKKEGKVLHFGVSNFTPSQFNMLQAYVPFPLVTNQIEISLLRVEPFLNGDLDLMLQHHISPMAWSPLGGGNLVDNERGIFSRASHYKATSTQLSLAWLLKHPSKIFPVIGTTKPDRIAEAAKAIDIELGLLDWFDMLRSAMGEELP